MPCISKLFCSKVDSVIKILDAISKDTIIVYAKCIRPERLIAEGNRFSQIELPGMSYNGDLDLRKLFLDFGIHCLTYCNIIILKRGDCYYMHVEPTPYTNGHQISEINRLLDLSCNKIMGTHYPIGFNCDPDGTVTIGSETPVCVSDALPMRKHSKCIDF